MRTLLLALLALLLGLVPFSRANAGESPAAPVVPALAKPAVVGASISSGFGLDPTSNPFAGERSKLQLAHVVDASILTAHETPWNGADMNFFSSPEGIAKRSAADAKSAKPTVLVALDYLFWLGYGPGSDENREARVMAGLKFLDTVPCILLVGDLPDFRSAGASPMFLPQSSIPPAETLARLNKRIYAWAKEKKNVVVVPQAEMLRKLIADEPIAVGGITFEKGSKAKLLQADNLHTTLVGTCALWATAVEAWRAQDPTIPAEAFLLEPDALAVKAEELARNPPVRKAKGQRAKPKEKVGEKSGAGG